MEAPLNRKSQLRAFLMFLCSPRPLPRSSSPSRLSGSVCSLWCKSSLRERRQVGQTVSCSNHALRQTLYNINSVSLSTYSIVLTHAWKRCPHGSWRADLIFSQQIAHVSSLIINSWLGTWTNRFSKVSLTRI